MALSYLLANRIRYGIRKIAAAWSIQALSGLLYSVSAFAVDVNYPASWFEPARTASQLGITEFSQSPVLEGRDLPPVDRRLPDDPVVITPLDSNGRYGGAARIIADDLSMFYSIEGLVTISPDHKTILPNLAESWSYSEDGRELTVTLRKGLKWSDGHDYTAEDVLFTVNDLMLNTEFMAVTLPNFVGVGLHALDDWTLVFVFDKPNPFFINFMAQRPDLFSMPRHYFGQFHPAYTDPEVVSTRIKNMGFNGWGAFITTSIQGLRIPDLVNQPTMRAYKAANLTPSLFTYERNPYYFKIDPAGQQLPYIDTIEAQDVRDNTVAIAQASTGQLDFAGIRLPTQEIPLLKLGETSSGIKVNIWNRLHGSDVVIQANMNFPDAEKRALYSDVRFRRALSLAINRDEMNEIIYFGRGTSRQVTVIPDSDYFEPEFATAYAEYDVAAANALLDDIGLFDVDGDGMRNLPSGAPLTIALEYVDAETPKQISMELVTSYWIEVGIDVRLRLIDRGLQYARGMAGEFEMTVWHADRTTDILFPINPDFWAPVKLAASLGVWSEWARWYQSDGSMGEEPPAEMRELQQWAEELSTTMDSARRIEVGKKILATNAEKVWTIGTVGLAPQPVVTSGRLRNVVQSGLWGWDVRWTMPYHPATWYLAQ